MSSLSNPQSNAPSESPSIVSLIPSGTDIACELGLSKYLQAISHACDNPATQNLPIVTRSVLQENLSPREIDDAVSAALRQDDGSLYRTDRDLLHRLQPDVILTQAICDVCAVNKRTALCDAPASSQLLLLDAIDFETLWLDILRVGRAAQVLERAQVLVASLQARLESVRQKLDSEARKTPSVLVLEWSDPPFIGGHWVPEIIARAGGICVPVSKNQPSRRADWDELAALEPDFVLLAPCGYSLEETREQGLQLIQDEPRFANLRAVRGKNVWVTDATHLFSRCTPASVRAVEVVASILRPEVFEAASQDEAQPLF
jgi:iron complex transport system substrate-binding protein